MAEERSGWLETRVEPLDSRAAVYIDVFLVDEIGLPTSVDTRCISIYSNRRHAEIAASWIQRAAMRGRPLPPAEPGC